MARLLVGGDTDVSAGFRHGPTLHQGKTKALFKSLQVFRINPRTETELDLCPQVIIFCFWLVQQNCRDYAQVVQAGSIGGAYRIPPVGSMETVQLNYATATHDHGHHGTQRVHVHQRQRRQHPLLTVCQAAVTVYACIPFTHAGEVFVAQHAALRRPGGSGSIQHRYLRILVRRARFGSSLQGGRRVIDSVSVMGMSASRPASAARTFSR